MTILTRSGGYLLLSRFTRLPPRVDAALEAVPAAVMTTLFAPAILSGGWREAVAMGVAVLVALRLGPTATLVICVTVLVTLRSL
ncbi:AzlD domain-containing protein [Acuticoccus sp. 2012]|uniref:AzlD domain-containing protein n=2 Tax=Acuticoccus mangrovi TaxID=2796142 RepID=A0A934INM5_9HYPH|nr:AzlD domain-containing protein [Acuticoccus mangrovi]